MSEKTPDKPNDAFNSSPPPERFTFPIQLLDQWMGIPDHEIIVAPLTKQDLDHFLFGLLRNNEALSALEATIVHWSNNNLTDANTSLLEFRRLNIESVNNIRQLFMAITVSALRGRPNASR